jgi:hypothetical protein
MSIRRDGTLTDSEAARRILTHSMQSEGSPYYAYAGGVAIVLSSKKST